MLVGASLVIAMGYGLVAPVLPAFARSFDVGVTAASVVVSAFAFARLVFAPVGGRAAERFGQRRVYLTGLLVVAASSAACAAAQSYWQLVIMRGLGGIGSTMFTISAMGLLVRFAPPGQRGRASGLFGSAFLIGNVAGPAVGALAAGLGMRVPFVLYAIALVAATVLVAVLLPDPDAPAEDAPGDAAVADGENQAAAPPTTLGRLAGGGEDGDGLRETLRDSAFRAALVSNFAHGWTNMGVRVAHVPLFAGTVALGVGDEQAAVWLPGIALTAFALGNILVVNFVGGASDRRGRRPFLLAGLGAGAILTAVFGLAASPPVLLALGFLAGVAAGTTAPAQQAALADVLGSGRQGRSGRVLAVFQMAGDAGSIGCPILAGLVVDAWGYGPAFALSGALLAVGALAWLFAREPLTRG